MTNAKISIPGIEAALHLSADGYPEAVLPILAAAVKDANSKICNIDGWPKSPDNHRKMALIIQFFMNHSDKQHQYMLSSMPSQHLKGAFRFILHGVTDSSDNDHEFTYKIQDDGSVIIRRKTMPKELFESFTEFFYEDGSSQGLIPARTHLRKNGYRY